MNEDSITIPAELVRYLRQGLQSQLSARVDMLAVALEGRIDEPRYREALYGFDDARTLLDTVGVGEHDGQDDVELDLSESGELVLKALESQHRFEVARLEDAAAHGVQIPERGVPQLGRLVADVRRRVSVSEGARRSDSMLETRGALGMCRSRDHGSG
jgi:hypothetical protein